MHTETKGEDRVWHIIERIQDKDKLYVEQAFDVLQWSLYGQVVFSQFGYSVYGWNFRQSSGNTTLVIKAQEAGVPLVAFVTSATPIGCIEQMFGLLENDRLKWQKDKYPAF